MKLSSFLPLASVVLSTVVILAGFILGISSISGDPQIVSSASYEHSVLQLPGGEYDLLAEAVDTETGDRLSLLNRRDTISDVKLSECRAAAELEATARADRLLGKPASDAGYDNLTKQRESYLAKMVPMLTAIYYQKGIPSGESEPVPASVPNPFEQSYSDDYAADQPTSIKLVAATVQGAENFDDLANSVELNAASIRSLESTLDQLIRVLGVERSPDGKLKSVATVTEAGGLVIEGRSSSAVSQPSSATTSTASYGSTGTSASYGSTGTSASYGSTGSAVYRSPSDVYYPQAAQVQSSKTVYQRAGLFGLRRRAVQVSADSVSSGTYPTGYSSTSGGTCTIVRGADGVYRQVCN